MQNSDEHFNLIIFQKSQIDTFFSKMTHFMFIFVFSTIITDSIVFDWSILRDASSTSFWLKTDLAMYRH